MEILIGVLIGLTLGFPAGVVIMAMLAMGGNDDTRNGRQEGQVRQ